LLEQLGPLTDVEGYQVRPPKAYSFSRPPGPPGFTGYAWAGALRGDKTAPQLLIGVVPVPPAEAKAQSPERFLEKMLEGVKRRRTNWTQTPPERGQVNGLTFVRARWSGTESAKGWKMHGFMYATQDGATFLQLSSQDVEPHHEHALKIAETAVLTFKKKNRGQAA
jgi:hypothetical protein